MDKDIQAEIAVEVLRDSVLRYCEEPATTLAQGGVEEVNPHKARLFTTMERFAEDLRGCDRVLGTAVDRYSALVDCKKWLKTVCRTAFSDMSIAEMVLQGAPDLLRKVTKVLEVKDVPAEVAEGIKRYRREEKNATKEEES